MNVPSVRITPSMMIATSRFHHGASATFRMGSRRMFGPGAA